MLDGAYGELYTATGVEPHKSTGRGWGQPVVLAFYSNAVTTVGSEADESTAHRQVKRRRRVTYLHTQREREYEGGDDVLVRCLMVDEATKGRRLTLVYRWHASIASSSATEIKQKS